MLRLQHLSCTLADNNAGRHRVASCHARHDGTVRYAKVVDSIDLEIAVYNRHGIASHLGRTRLMVVSKGPLANEVFKLRPFQVTGHHLAFDVWTERRRVAYLSA